MTTPANSDEQQWVNVPTDERFRSTTGAGPERLGPVMPSLTFKNAEPGSAKVRIVPEGGNLTYKGNELRRNQNFRLRAGGKVLKATGPSKLDADAVIDLPAAGGNRYRFEALNWDKSIVPSPFTVEAHRCVHFEVFAPSEVLRRQRTIIDYALDQLVAAFAKGKRNIRLVQTDKHGELANGLVYDVRDPDEPSKLIDSAHEPMLSEVAEKTRFLDPQIGVAIVFVPYLADRITHTVNQVPVKLANGSGSTFDFSWKFDKDTCRFHVTIPPWWKFLWHELDRTRVEPVFLRSLELRWGDANITLPGANTRIEGEKVHTYGGRREFSVDYSKSKSLPRLMNVPATLEVTLDTIHSFWRGLSYGPSVIAVALRDDFEDVPKEEVAATLIHEMGHRFGLCANGDLKKTKHRKPHTPNAHGGYYDEFTTETDARGGHCEPRACIMHGSVGGKDFCAECEEALRRLDLTDITR